MVLRMDSATGFLFCVDGNVAADALDPAGRAGGVRRRRGHGAADGGGAELHPPRKMHGNVAADRDGADGADAAAADPLVARDGV